MVRTDWVLDYSFALKGLKESFQNHFTGLYPALRRFAPVWYKAIHDEGLPIFIPTGELMKTLIELEKALDDEIVRRKSQEGSGDAKELNDFIEYQSDAIAARNQIPEILTGRRDENRPHARFCLKEPSSRKKLPEHFSILDDEPRPSACQSLQEPTTPPSPETIKHEAFISVNTKLMVVSAQIAITLKIDDGQPILFKTPVMTAELPKTSDVGHVQLRIGDALKNELPRPSKPKKRGKRRSVRLEVSQEQVAKDTGIALRTIQYWESGEVTPLLNYSRFIRISYIVYHEWLRRYHVYKANKEKAERARSGRSKRVRFEEGGTDAIMNNGGLNGGCRRLPTEEVQPEDRKP